MKKKRIKILYTTKFQRYIAGILLVSFTLLNCGGGIELAMKKGITKELYISEPKFLNSEPILSSDKKIQIQFLETQIGDTNKQALLTHILPTGFNKIEICEVKEHNEKLEKILTYKGKLSIQSRIHVTCNPKTKKHIISIGIKGKGGNEKNKLFREYYEKDNIGELEKMLDQGIDPNTYFKNRTLLHLCIIQNKVDIARLLLNYEANPNLKTKNTEETANIFSSKV